MLNIEQELDLVHGGGYDLGRIVSHNNQYILAELRYCGLYSHQQNFDRITGVVAGDNTTENPMRLRPKARTQPVDHFYVRAGRQDWDKTDWLTLPGIDETDVQIVKDKVKEFNGAAQTTDSPFRFKIHKETEMSPVLDYPSWMEARFATGEYQQLPWANEPWVIKDHFAHVSKSDPFKVAFLENDAYGQQDYFQALAPGRYLKRYYDEVLTPTEIQKWAVALDTECELKFAHTEDEMVDIYVRGPHSCMVYEDSHSVWGGRRNPVRVYGAGDLALAYLTRRDTIVGRALVWPAKKAVMRSYGDVERIRMALGEAGYQFDCDTDNIDSQGSGLFNGAKVHRRETGNTVIMPYLDYHYRADILDDDYLVLSRDGDIVCNRTDGMAEGAGYSVDDDDEDEYDYSCDRCGDGVDDAYTVNNEYSWCYSCYHNAATTCDYCHEPYSSDRIVSIVDANTGDQNSDCCRDCRDDTDNVLRDHQGRLVDAETAQTCADCSTVFGNEYAADECPNTDCQVHQTEDA